nr:hypothetical protein [Nodosilinea sp. TSF1-S3]MDF0367492.1 hypothetical protein [Nodosilinea sp. TSF1-S3]
MIYSSSLISLGPNLMGRQAKFARHHLLDTARSLSSQGMGDCRGANIQFFRNAGQSPALLA